MRSFFLILFLTLCFIKTSLSNSLSDATSYRLSDCLLHGNVINLDVDTKNKNAKLKFDPDYFNSRPIALNLESIKENEVKFSKFLAKRIADYNRFDYSKWQKLSLEHTTIQVIVFPKTKKVRLIWKSEKTTKKDVLKAFKIMWGKPAVNRTDDYSCLSSVVFEKNTDQNPPKEIEYDNDQIIAAASGSGFFISNYGHIITNFHVIDECEKNVIYSGGRELESFVVSSDKINDLSILKVNYNPRASLPISNEDVSLLEDVIVAGYPLGRNVSAAIKTHKGVVTSLAGAGDNFSNFQTDADINQGNSGGPILNQKGNVVGVAVATWVQEGVQGVHFGIKSSTLKTFVKSNGVNIPEPFLSDLTNKDLGQLIVNATVYIECHMSVAKVKKMLNDSKNRKAFYNTIK